MPATLPVSPFGLRLRQLADQVDDYVAGGATLREAVARCDEYECAEICQTLGADDACAALAMRQLAGSVTALASAQSAADARLQPLLARAVEAMEREAAAREVLARAAGRPSEPAAVARTTIDAARRLGERAMASAWFGGIAVLVVGAALRSCEVGA